MKRDGNKRGVAKALRGVKREAWKKEGSYTMISERLIKIRFKVGNSHLIAIAVYAPTEVDEQAESEKLYEALQDQLDRASKKDFLLYWEILTPRWTCLLHVAIPWLSQH